MLVLEKRNGAATRRFFTRALTTTTLIPVQVITDKAAVYPCILDEVAPGGLAPHRALRQQPDRADYGRLESRLGRCADSNSSAAPE